MSNVGHCLLEIMESVPREQRILTMLRVINVAGIGRNQASTNP